MAKNAPRLGRSLASLIGDTSLANEPLRLTPSSRHVLTREIPVASIHPNQHQPRRDIDPTALQHLADSITTTGVIQPIVVRQNADRYELVAGERRWRAAGLAGLATIPAIVRDLTDEQMLLIALIENLQREDLTAIDRARAYRDCRDQFNLSPEDLATQLGEDRTTVTNYLRLLDLPDSVQDLLRSGTLSMGHARSLLGLADTQAMDEFAQRAIAERLSVRQLEALVRQAKETPSPSTDAEPRKPKQQRPLIQDLEQRFAEALSTRVTIREGRKKHTGRIIIEYYGLDDFDRIAERLGVTLEEL